MVHCTNCGKELTDAMAFCPTCGTPRPVIPQQQQTMSQQATESRPEQTKSRRKSPWKAALLNFFLPGIGFVYLGGTLYIIGGVILFALEIISTIAFPGEIFNPTFIAAGILLSFLWAALGYISAERINVRLGATVTAAPAPTSAQPPVQALPKVEAMKPAEAKERIYCYNCGTENSADAVFCRSCGTKIVRPEAL